MFLEKREWKLKKNLTNYPVILLLYASAIGASWQEGPVAILGNSKCREFASASLQTVESFPASSKLVGKFFTWLKLCEQHRKVLLFFCVYLRWTFFLRGCLRRHPLMRGTSRGDRQKASKHRSFHSKRTLTWWFFVRGRSAKGLHSSWALLVYSRGLSSTKIFLCQQLPL